MPLFFFFLQQSEQFSRNLEQDQEIRFHHYPPKYLQILLCTVHEFVINSMVFKKLNVADKIFSDSFEKIDNTIVKQNIFEQPNAV